MQIDERWSEEAALVLYPGDTRGPLRSMPDSSVPLVITSPPYDIGKDYEGKRRDWTTMRATRRLHAIMEVPTNRRVDETPDLGRPGHPAAALPRLARTERADGRSFETPRRRAPGGPRRAAGHLLDLAIAHAGALPAVLRADPGPR